MKLNESWIVNKKNIWLSNSHERGTKKKNLTSNGESNPKRIFLQSDALPSSFRKLWRVLHLSYLWRWSRFHVDVWSQFIPQYLSDIPNIMTFLGVKILLSCVFLIYVNVEAAPSPQVRQVQKLFIIFWNSMVKRQSAKTEPLGFDSPLKVKFFSSSLTYEN